MLDYLAGLTVPHSYFKHFYVASVVSSLFWATQLAVHGPAFRFLSYGLQEQDEKSSMHLSQVVLCWVVMLIQGTRRLYESIALAKPSQARMWFVHWVLGIGFYVAMGISIWIEGIRKYMLHELHSVLRIKNCPMLINSLRSRHPICRLQDDHLCPSTDSFLPILHRITNLPRGFGNPARLPQLSCIA